MNIRRMLSVAAVLTLTTAVSANAANNPLSTRYSATTKFTKAVSAPELRDVGVPEALIKRFVEAVSTEAGIPEIPDGDFPTVHLRVDGDGDIKLDASIPVATELPVQVAIRRCATCTWFTPSLVWPQATWNIKPARPAWIEVKSIPDILNDAYVANIKASGIYEVKVAVFHPAGVFLVTSFRNLNVPIADFYTYGCSEISDNTVALSIGVEALTPIPEGSPATFTVAGIERTLILSADRQDSRHAQGSISIPRGQYDALLAGAEISATLVINGRRTVTRLTPFSSQPPVCVIKG